MNPTYTAMRLAGLILALNAKNKTFLEHFTAATQKELREAIRDHEDALVKRQIEDAELREKGFI